MASPGPHEHGRQTLAYAPDYEREVLESETIAGDDDPDALLSALTIDPGVTLTLDGELPSAAALELEIYNSGKPDDRSGEIIHERYRLVRLLGKGGMGSVYLARHTGLPKTFAVKLLHPRYASRPDVFTRFLHEAQAVSMIEHENVVGVTDFGALADGGAFLVMEHLRGESLAALCKREAPLPWPRVRHLMLQVCRALAAAHAVGVIHRDIKPENILRTSRHDDADYLKILDFGLAKLQAGHGLRLTRTGMVLGTPEYMSPEQARAAPTDHRTDIYATGALMYELLCGRPPFQAKTFVGMRNQHLLVRPAPPSVYAPRPSNQPGHELTAELDAICLRALAKRPEHRFASIAAMQAAIEAVGTGAGPVPLPELADDQTPTIELDSGAHARTSIRSPAAAIAPAPARSRTPVILAGVLGVGIVVGGVVATIVTGAWPLPAADEPEAIASGSEAPAAAPEPAPIPEPEPAPDAVELRLTTNVPVRVLDARDQSLFGRGQPLEQLELPRSETALTLILRADGYRDAELRVTPDRDQELRVTLEPNPSPSPAPTPKPAPSATPKPAPKPTVEPAPEPEPEPIPEPTPEPEPGPKLPPVDPELVDPWRKPGG